MLFKVSPRAVPLVLMILSALWTAAIFFPLVYSVLSPTKDIQQIVGALEGHESLPAEFATLTQGAIDSVGKLKRAIQVGAYWHASADYNPKASHTTKTTQISYLAWFEKRSKPTILIVTRTEIDRSRVQFNLGEGKPLGIFEAYLPPLLLLGASIYWLQRKRSADKNVPLVAAT